MKKGVRRLVFSSVETDVSFLLRNRYLFFMLDLGIWEET